MARREDDPLCESVRDYCFDLLFPELGGEAPLELRRHAAACPTCRQRLNDVKQLLGVLSGPQLHQHLFSRQLTQHFDLLGAEVRCGDIRQFLPFLADENLLMRIPTPVTVHRDQCPQCGHDVRTIASLMLKGEQLARLSGLYSHDYQPRPDDCPKFAGSIKTLASLRLERIDSEAARHICTCRRCRTALYEERLRLKFQNRSVEGSRIPCAAVKPVDMFDFLVPFGLDLHRRQYEKFTGVLADHLRECPTCLERMRQLHNIIYTIDTRGDSGVKTIYRFAPGKRQRAMTNVSEQYPTWPIKVHASGPGFEKKPKPSLKSRLTQKLTQHAQKLKLRQLAKLTATAAVLILMALFFMKMPSAKAVTLSEVYSAFERILNAHVVIMRGSDGAVIQHTWASAKYGLLLRTMKGKFTLWDLKSGTSTYKTAEDGAVRTIQLSPELLAKTEKAIEDYSDMMPFSDEHQVPPGHTWGRINDPNVEGRVPGTVVYDLTWKEEDRLIKWRAFIDVPTNLPKMSELYVETDTYPAFSCVKATLYEYPTDDEFMAGIDAIIVEPESVAAGKPPSIPALSP